MQSGHSAIRLTTGGLSNNGQMYAPGHSAMITIFFQSVTTAPPGLNEAGMHIGVQNECLSRVTGIFDSAHTDSVVTEHRMLHDCCGIRPIKTVARSRLSDLIKYSAQDCARLCEVVNYLAFTITMIGQKKPCKLQLCDK